FLSPNQVSVPPAVAGGQVVHPAARVQRVDCWAAFHLRNTAQSRVYPFHRLINRAKEANCRMSRVLIRKFGEPFAVSVRYRNDNRHPHTIVNEFLNEFASKSGS